MLRLFVIKPSLEYLLLLFAVHLLAMIAVCLTNFDVLLRIFLMLLIALNWRREYKRNQQLCCSFSLNKRRIQLKMRSGAEWIGEVTGQTLVTARCVVLCVQLKGRKWPIYQLVFSDSMSFDAFRELRVRLRYS